MLGWRRSCGRLRLPILNDAPMSRSQPPTQLTAPSWKSLGRIFGPDRGAPWMRSHAQVPTPLIDETEGLIRVYFASRPEAGCSMTGFVDLDLQDPTRVRYVHPHPLLELGKPGTFDEHGVMPSCAVRRGNQVYLYYSGWSRGTTVPYTNSTGLAISEDGGRSFRRISDGPILGKSIVDPYSATSPFVTQVDGQWRMWYCAGTDWVLSDGKYEHVYDIKIASSDDGVNWRPTGQVALSTSAQEQALTRPWLLQGKDGWTMWYCHRQALDFRDGAGAYRLAAARSRDALNWERTPGGVPMVAGQQAWDGKARAYPAVLAHGNRLLMFYNGNGFGADGFGLAQLDLTDSGCKE